MSRLGEVMKNARARIIMDDGRPMSQEDLAEVAGMHPGTIGQLESGRSRRPERETLETIAAALHLTYNDLAIAAGMADPPTEHDIEAEIRRLDMLPTLDEKIEALKKLSPEVYDLVEAWAHDLVDQAAGRRREGDRQRQPGEQRDHRRS